MSTRVLKQRSSGTELNNLNYKRSDRLESIQDEDFNMFFSAYENHKHAQQMNCKKVHKTSDLTTNITSNMTCPKTSGDQFSLDKANMASAGNSKMLQPPQVNGSPDKISPSGNFDGRGPSILHTIDSLKQIEDDIEDDY